MARTSFFKLLTFLSFALFATAAPRDLETRSTTKPVKFTIDLTWGDVNPIGAASPRKAILSNGTIPGPALHLTEGDNVEFLVHNHLPNKTSIHFHGIEQKDTPWSDGVPGLSQHAIESNKSFLYKWTANEAGVYFYHAHYQGQIMDGLYGAIVIKSKADAPRPWSFISNDTAAQAAMTAADDALKPVFLSDWSKYNSAEFHEIEKAGNIDEACADAILVNGVGSQYCLSRDQITAYTSPKLPPLLAAVNPPQLTDKGCLPPNLPATQGNYTFNVAAIPRDAYYDCVPSTGKMAVIEVDATKKYAALTFIHTGGFELFKFTVDGHKMWVYALDGHYTVPQKTDIVFINNGDRVSVLIELNQTPAEYALRVANNGLNQVISGFGVIKYKGATGPASSDPNALSTMNYGGINTTIQVPFVAAKAVPYPPVKVAATSDVTFTFNVLKLPRPAGAYEWTLTGKDAYNMTRDDDKPLLFQQPKDIATSPVIIRTNMGQWVDLIIKVVGPLAQPHPMHKHSNKAFVLGQGVGPFNFSTVAEAAAHMPNGTFNFNNPPYRDGYTTTPAEGNSSWMALRYHVENPGAFLFHCHMQTHLSGGMGFAILDGVDKWPTSPDVYVKNNGVVTSLSKTGKTHTV